MQMLRGDHCLWSWKLDHKLLWLQTLPDDLQGSIKIYDAESPKKVSWYAGAVQSFVKLWKDFSTLMLTSPVTLWQANLSHREVIKQGFKSPPLPPVRGGCPLQPTCIDHTNKCLVMIILPLESWATSVSYSAATLQSPSPVKSGWNH